MVIIIVETVVYVLYMQPGPNTKLFMGKTAIQDVFLLE